MYTLGNKQIYEITTVDAGQLLGEVALLPTAHADDILKQRDDLKRRINTALSDRWGHAQVDVFVNECLVDDPNDIVIVEQLFRSTQEQDFSIAEKAFEEFCEKTHGYKSDSTAKNTFLAGWMARAMNYYEKV